VKSFPSPSRGRKESFHHFRGSREIISLPYKGEEEKLSSFQEFT
jgi:hypothetical protein